MKTATNPPVLIALDVANTYGKGTILYLENNEVRRNWFSIPHGYMPLSANQWKQVQSTINAGRIHNAQTHSFEYVTGGDAKNPETKAVTIGKSATLSGTNATMYGNAKYQLGYFDAYLTAVLCECFPKKDFPKGYDNIYLAVGYPSSDWQMVDSKLLPLVNKVHRVIEADGSRRSFTPRHTMMIDENGGGMMNTLYRMLDEKTRESQTGRYTSLKAGERILILDAGGWLGSLAWGEVSENGFPQIDYTAGRIIPIDGGIVTVRHALKDALKGRYASELQGMTDALMDDKWLDDILLHKAFRLSGRKLELDAYEQVMEASGVYLNNLKAAYQRMGNGLQAEHVIVTGGTIRSLYEPITDILNHGSIILADKLEEIYKANVRGMLQILIDGLLASEKMPEELLPFFEKRKV